MQSVFFIEREQRKLEENLLLNKFTTMDRLKPNNSVKQITAFIFTPKKTRGMGNTE